MKISIILTTYNRADKFLPESIESVLNQSYGEFELIIVDDASTDNTKSVVSSYKDPRIKYIRMPENWGSDTRPKNIGASEASGTYLMFLDDDVRLTKDALVDLSRVLDENHEIDVVYGDMMIVREDGKTEPGIARDFDAQFLMLRNYIDTSSAMMRREALFRVGGWDETLPKFIDWNLWVRMSKAGVKFQRLPKTTFFYSLHEDAKSQRVKTEMYLHPKLGMLFVPTFDPAGCRWHVGYLGRLQPPVVAIFTIHYDRLEYSKETYKQMKETAGYPFRWFCIDNGSKDGTAEWLKERRDNKEATVICLDKNVGITKASNMLVSEIMRKAPPDIIIKVDNDVEFQTYGWLKDIVELWKINRMIYVSPYVEGLIHNPGGAPRQGYGLIGDEYVEVTNHVGGIFAAIDSSAYEDFRWEDKMLHGSQDIEASHAFRTMGYMPCYYPKHRIKHMDSTEGQWDKYKEYFERRKVEKQTEG